MARAFQEEPDLGALTGLVLPLEIETPAQELFERLGGFGRGFVRRWETEGTSSGRPRTGGTILGAGEFGTGANMAFRRAVFDRIGGFDPALGVGTPARGGGDLEMFHRVLAGGQSSATNPPRSSSTSIAAHSPSWNRRCTTTERAVGDDDVGSRGPGAPRPRKFARCSAGT